MQYATGLRIAVVQLDYLPRLVSKQGLWLPDEPLTLDDPLSRSADDFSVKALRSEPALEEPVATLTRHSEEHDIEQSLSKLRQILQFARSQLIDLVVLPEGCLPPAALGLLYEYAGDVAVFAGLGRIRDDDLPHLPIHERDRLAARNCAVLVDDGSTTFVTKQFLAEEEGDTNPGEGPVVHELKRRERSYRLGLTICLDYLQEQSRLGQQDVDCVLVSALSPATKDFVSDTPRNYIRVFANHARYGASTIVAPNLLAPALASRNRVNPLPAGEEALVTIDFQGFAKRPSGTKPPDNRLVHRGAILYASRDAETYDPSRIASELGRLGHNDVRPGSTGFETVRRWRDALQQRQHQLTLTEALNALLAQASQRTLMDTSFPVFATHLSLSDVPTVRESRYRQLEAIQRMLARHFASATPIARAGAYQDRYRSAAESLIPAVRRIYRTEEHQYQRRDEDSRDGNQRIFFAARLGSFDTEDAVRSLARQLAALRTFAHLENPDLQLTYRLSTAEGENGDLLPSFDVVGSSRGDAENGEIATLREGLGQQLGQAFSGAWNISGTRALPDLETRHIYELKSIRSQMPSLREDWASLTDYLRALRNPVSVELICQWTEDGDGAIGGGAEHGDDDTHIDHALVSDSFIDESERAAAAFFLRTAGDEPINGSLVLRLRIGSNNPLNEAVMIGIGVTILGDAEFDILEGDPEPGSTGIGRFQPSVAQRLFHPPYGRMQGRGLSSRRRTSIIVSGHTFPSDGIALGKARTALGREDEIVDVRLDEETRLRHTYVVGRTGSGKTNLLKLMARQDIAAGRGVAVIDPHGDLVEYLLGHLAGREHDTLLLDFGRAEYMPVLNPIDLDVNSPADRALAIEEFIRILVQQSYHEFYGPRFEDIVRLTLESIIHPNYPFTPSVLDITRLLRSADRRRWLRGLLSDTELAERWRVFDQQRESEIAEVLHWALSKFSEMSQDGVLGQVLSGGESTVSIAEPVERGDVLLVRLPEWEMSASAANFLGTFIQERIRRAAYSRWREANATRTRPDPFYLYVDEFQNFATSGFENLVAEARKFGLALTLANQNLAQLNRFSRFTGTISSGVMDSLLANVASLVVLGVSSRDEQVLSEEMGVRRDSLRNIGAYSGLMRTMPLSGAALHTFSLDISNADSDAGSPRTRVEIAARMVSAGAWRARTDISDAIAMREKQMTEHVKREKPAETSFAELRRRHLPRPDPNDDGAEESAV